VRLQQFAERALFCWSGLSDCPQIIFQLDHISKTMHSRTLSDIELFPVAACPSDSKGVSYVSKHSVQINDVLKKLEV
jgi:hypothetical protein